MELARARTSAAVPPLPGDIFWGGGGGEKAEGDVSRMFGRLANSPSCSGLEKHRWEPKNQRNSHKMPRMKALQGHLRHLKRRPTDGRSPMPVRPQGVQTDSPWVERVHDAQLQPQLYGCRIVPCLR